MGRRSINTTKSGKFMNPTDQARKEARKKELKKNKKQRLLVRTAVLKNKDPGLIIQELDKLDEVEFNPVEAPALADKVLKDKRKKLKETLDRVMRLYQKEDPTMWNELRQIEADYERRRFHRVQYYEAVKQAESLVNIEEIPLPIEEQPSVSDIPLPDMPPPPSSSSSSSGGGQPTSILKHSGGSSSSSSHRLLQSIDTESPGVPVGSPPELSSGEEDEDEEEGIADERMETNTTSSNNNNTTTTTSTTSDKRNEDSSKRERSNSKSDKGNKKSVHFDDLDEFMKEIEEEFKTNEEELQPPGMEKKSKDSQQQQQQTTQKQQQQVPLDTNKSVPLPPPSMPPGPPPNPNRIQFYGQPPPQLAPPFPAPPNRPRIPVPPPAAYRIPPPPRPAFPPNFQRPQRFRATGTAGSGTSSVFSSGPQINPSQQREVITAKPQLRSLSADVTRFIPVAVKTKAAQHKDDIGFSKTQQQQPQKPAAPIPQPGPSKDDAYADFMKEMQGLL